MSREGEMKKVLKIIAIVIVVIVAAGALLLNYLGKRPVVADDYMEKIETGGEIEAKYLAMGTHPTARIEQAGMHDFKKFIIWYPSDMVERAEKVPVVIFSNGTGINGSKYEAVQKHLASWGFIVMATEEENSWYGYSSELCLRFIMRVNETETMEGWETNPFYGRVDLENIGVSGHSQGGVGVINAATENKNGGMVKAIFSASPTNLELAHGLMWDYDPGLISVPVLFVSGTGDADEKLVVSGAQIKEIFDAVPDSVFKVRARRSGADHGDMLTIANGYMNAWFMWQLRGDEEAAKAFVGESPEILRNELYQDQEIG